MIWFTLQLVEVILETAANQKKPLQSCAEKYEVVIALYHMKLDLV